MNEYGKFKVFLTAMEAGLDIEIDGHTYSMGLDSKDMPRLAHKMMSTDGDGNKKEVLMQGLMLPDINNFIIMIMNSISDDDVAVIAANIGLNKKNKPDEENH